MSDVHDPILAIEPCLDAEQALTSINVDIDVQIDDVRLVYFILCVIAVQNNTKCVQKQYNTFCIRKQYRSILAYFVTDRRLSNILMTINQFKIRYNPFASNIKSVP